MKEWLDALKVAKDIVTGGISAYQAGEEVDKLIKRSVDEYGALLSEEEKDLQEQCAAAKNNDQKTSLRLEYLETLIKNASLPEDFRTEVEESAQAYKEAENFAFESMESTIMKYAETDEQRETIKNTVDGIKIK